jgi:pyroglutamyl-peptidase
MARARFTVTNGCVRRGRLTILITGFGPFPGTPVNATMQLVPELTVAARKRFPDLCVASEILKTEWQAAPSRLRALLAEATPDVALHFGVSKQARGFEIEARARNICSHALDASGALPDKTRLCDGDAPESLAAKLPVSSLLMRLRLLGVPAFASRDAGTYLCNALFYHSLDYARQHTRPVRIGFIHVPVALIAAGLARGGACPLSWDQALAGGLEIIAACVGRLGCRQSRA